MSASRRRKTSDRTSPGRKRAKPERDAAEDLPELEADDTEALPELEAVDNEELPELEPDDTEELPELDAVDPEELPEFEAVDAYADLEPRAANPVTIEHAPSDDPDFDRRIEVTVPDMPKPDVPAAVEPPLRRVVATTGAALRFRRVLVHFGGDALVGSAMKELVAAVLAPAKPLQVVVRRGFGDEVVHEGTLPTVRLDVDDRGDALHVDVDTGGCDADDVAFALAAELPQLAGRSADRRVAFRFPDGADDATRSAIATALTAARRVEIDGAVLFDRALEQHVRVKIDGDLATLEIDPAPSEAETVEALDLVLPRAVADLSGKDVTLEFAGGAPRAGELAHAVELLAAAAPRRLALARSGDEPDVLWPRLLRTATRDDQGAVKVEPAGRGRSALVAAFAREAAGLAPVVAGKRVTIDWPAGFALDAELEQRCIAGAIGAHGPTSVSCTFGGQDREPFVPPPLTFRVDPGDLHVVHVDTDTGKPVELVRAIERRVGAVAGELRGNAVRIEIAGAGAVSRTMVRTLRELVEQAGATRVELDDHGSVDVLLPALLRIGADGAGTVTLAADAAGRDAAQVELALQRELDAAEIPAGAAFVIEPAPEIDAVVAAVVGRGASRVVVGGVQVHPALFGTPEPDGDRVVLVAAPHPGAPGRDVAGGDVSGAAPSDGDADVVGAQVERELGPLLDGLGPLEAMDVTLVWPGAATPPSPPLRRTLDAIVARGPRRLLLDDGSGRALQVHPEIVPDYVTVLGRKADAEPPLSMLGIDTGTGDEHRAKVLDKLASVGDDLDGRRVLLVLREQAHDVAVEDGDPLVAAVREVVDPRAAATLVFRGDDRHGRPHFEVVHSTLETLPVGTRVADPRPRA